MDTPSLRARGKTNPKSSRLRIWFIEMERPTSGSSAAIRFVSRRQPASACESPRLFGRTRVGVCFDFAPLLFHNTAQFALHRFERVVDYFFEQFVSAVIHLLFIGNQLVPGRHGQIDTAPVRISFVVRVIRLLDRDIAAVDVIAKLLEASCIFQNEIVNVVRFFQTPIRYLNRQLHSYLDTTVVVAIEGAKISIPSPVFKSAVMSGNG
jgi:hypothetical protein